MRINKYIAKSGITSRRKADELVENGRVKVNGEIIKKLGYDVKEDDLVEIDERKISLQKKYIYLIMNKPTGFVTTMSDEYDRPTVMDLIPDVEERVYPVGRLDMNTSGLLIFTNDGELANALTHPSTNVNKKYKLLCNGILNRNEVKILEKGVNIDGYKTSPCEIKIIKHLKASTMAEIIIHEGKKRQIRRMFETIGHPVQKLERIAIGDIKIGHMKQGSVRKLSDDEVRKLKGNA